MKTNPKDLNTVLVTDCGSTTTKALLFQKTKDGWRKTQRGEAPTTVEAPVADVTVGALNAFLEIQEVSNRKILSDSNNIFEEGSEEKGIDLYLSTSSAGGGLQMLVSGLVSHMTTESARRAALGAGAIVLEAFSADDGLKDFERIEKIRHLKPDIFLLTGGIDGGAEEQIVEMAETLLSASPRPRFGNTLSLPVIYAGNNELQDEISKILKPLTKVQVLDNVRPELGVENLSLVREAIHELFLSHVMSHSPGYDKLLSWSPIPILPTPSAVGLIIENYAKESNQNVLCVDIGGATTDIFSVFRNEEEKTIFNRTVSANLGMSYSVANVLVSTGVDNIAKWLPYEISKSEIIDRLRNKMIRPTSIPQEKEDLWLEQAVCREALNLSLDHHKSLAVGLGGVQKKRSIADIFSQSSKEELVDMMQLDLVVGSGGVLSHAPLRVGSALMMMDGFQLQGLTKIAVDSIFMLPHLGVLSTVHKEAANEIFHNDCLINIVHSITPIFPQKKVKQLNIAEIKINEEQVGVVQKGIVENILLEKDKEFVIEIKPLHSLVDVGAGQGKIFKKKIISAEFGLFLDGRNNNFEDINIEKTKEIYNNLGL